MVSSRPHVLLADQDADGGPAREAPVAADEVQLRFDVVDEQRHVVRQVELGHLEDQREAQHRLAGDAVDFAGAQRADRPRRSALTKKIHLKK